MIKSFFFIVYSEVLLLVRHTHQWLYPLAFFMIVFILFPIGLSPDPEFLQNYGAGCAWIAILLANLLSMEQLFLSDIEDAYIEQLLISSGLLSIWISAKLLAKWLVTILPLILLAPIIVYSFQSHTKSPSLLFITLLIGTPLLTLIGAFITALTFGLKHQGAFIGLLFFPLILPVLLFSVTIIKQSQAGFDIMSPLLFFLGISLLSMVLLPWFISETIKISMDD